MVRVKLLSNLWRLVFLFMVARIAISAPIPPVQMNVQNSDDIDLLLQGLKAHVTTAITAHGANLNNLGGLIFKTASNALKASINSPLSVGRHPTISSKPTVITNSSILADGNKTEDERYGKFDVPIPLKGGNVMTEVEFKSAAGVFEVEFKSGDANTLTVSKKLATGIPPTGFRFLDASSFNVKLAKPTSPSSGLKIDYSFDTKAFVAAGVDTSKAVIGKLCHEANVFVVDNLGKLEFEADDNELMLSVKNLVGEWAVLAPYSAFKRKSASSRRRCRTSRSKFFPLVPTRPSGTADIVGFGLSGVFILRNSLFLKVRPVLNDFGFNAGGWRNESHVRLLADTTGDKSLDIVGFGEEGVMIALNQGNNNFSPGQLVLRNFAIGAGGWHTHKHIRFMADMRNTGRCDIVGFGQDGVIIAENKGNLQFSSPALRLKDFGYNQGWRLDRHLRFLADVTGNGLLDIVGFGESNVWVALNAGNGRFLAPKAVVNELCISAGGWQVYMHPRFVADLTGSKRCDLLGFSHWGTVVALNRGDGTFDDPKGAVEAFGYAGGWRVEKHLRLLADIDGDGLPDIVGFGESGVWVAINNGDGTFQPAKKVIEDSFGYSPDGWTAEKHPRFAVDLTGDGTADLIGFGKDAVFVSYNDGKGNFGPCVKLIDDFSVAQGWSVERSVRFLVNLYA
ncbi:hypothetical protein BJ165DRAFT_1531835 [Panaeolus papilionaceus]|nr:hypothetical protein BJ165DRAFT_1531835 [Panaeolus papilionaceus]